MSIDTEAPIKTKPALELKSTSFSVPVLVITNPELELIAHQLEEKISLAPEFFSNTPLLIDLQECNQQGDSIDLQGLIKYLQSKMLFPIGICGGNEEQNSLALEINIPTHTLYGTNPNNTSTDHKVEKKPVEEPIKGSSTQPSEPLVPRVENILISHPIRSGQRIYARGDLIILSHVSAGAEVMAEGNIHIYGALRGKALAGVLGNTESRIFCTTLEAELISIAGHYKISEELEKNNNHKATQIYLQNQALVFKHL